MLRALVVALLVANLAFFSWAQGWLDGVTGVRARGDREPERLARQVQPESVVILSASSGASAVAAAPGCLEAGPYAPAEIGAAEAALRGLAPPGSWTDLRTEKAGSWLVYMGSYPDRETLRRKVEEIGRTRVDTEEVAVPGEGEFGLSLGRYDDRGAAERALLLVQQRGIRTARVVQSSAPSVTHTLRIERADPALAAQLTSTRVEALGKGFVACVR